MAGILGRGIQDGLLLKPVKYQWAMDLYNQAVANTWFPNEIQLGQDLADWKKMTDEERHALTFLMSYFNPNELLVNKALAFGVYPYVNAAEAHLYLAKQMWEEANHCMSFEYVLETFPIDRDKAYAALVDTPSMAKKEAFEAKFITRMTQDTIDIETTEGKKDFIPEVLEKLGFKPIFHKISQKPGKPLYVGNRADGKLVFAFPGNPISTLTCFWIYFLPWVLGNPLILSTIAVEFTFLKS